MTPKVIEDVEWNFDAVPDAELVACCYWEYARESAFIRDTLHCYREWFLADGRWDDARSSSCERIEQIQSIGYAAEVFIRGCAFPANLQHQSSGLSGPNYRHPHAPIITGSFPAAWLSLSPEERKERAQIRTDRSVIPLVPFKRGNWHDAQDIARWAEGRWQMLHAEYEKVRRENPDSSEVELIRQGKLKEFPGIQPSLYWESGGEITVVSIQWSDFTNEELTASFRKWVKTNRPRRWEIPMPGATNPETGERTSHA
jgi:hypothetical protein